MFNIIDEPVFRVVSEHGVESLGIAEILHRFRRDDILTFSALRRHQAAPFHMFLAQLAATAAHRWGDMPETAADWAEAIFALTGGDKAPWEAIQEDPLKAGFMQYPMTVEYDKSYDSPDEMDIIYQSRHHSHKMGGTRLGLIDDWLFALIATQTCDRTVGPSVYGVARTGSGYAFRPFCGLAPNGNMGARVLRDVEIMVSNFDKVAQTYGYDPDGIDLVWTAPWDLETQLPLESLAPYFIECCRPFRLVQTNYGFKILRVISKAPRIDGRERNGVLGDHWMPIRLNVAKKGETAEPGGYGVNSQGWTADVLTRILFGKDGQRHFQLPASFEQRKGEAGLRAVFNGIGREQGKIAGYFEREIPMRKQMLSLMGSQNGRDELAEISSEILREHNQIIGACKYAVWPTVNGGDLNDVRPNYDVPAFTAAVRYVVPRIDAMLDETFFEDLQDRLEDPSIRVTQIGRKIFEARQKVMRLIETLPVSRALRPRVLYAAENAYDMMIFAKNGIYSAHREEILAMRRVKIAEVYA